MCCINIPSCVDLKSPFMWIITIVCVICRSQERKQPNFGFPMMKCPQRPWPRSAVNVCLSLQKLHLAAVFVFLSSLIWRLLCARILLIILSHSWCINAKHLIFHSFIFLIQIQGIKLMVRWLLGVKNNQSKSGNSTLRMLTAILHSDGDLTEQGKMG